MPLIWAIVTAWGCRAGCQSLTQYCLVRRDSLDQKLCLYLSSLASLCLRDWLCVWCVGDWQCIWCVGDWQCIWCGGEWLGIWCVGDWQCIWFVGDWQCIWCVGEWLVCGRMAGYLVCKRLTGYLVCGRLTWYLVCGRLTDHHVGLAQARHAYISSSSSWPEAQVMTCTGLGSKHPSTHKYVGDTTLHDAQVRSTFSW